MKKDSFFEKGDIAALVCAAFLVFLPVFLLIFGILVAVIWIFL